MSIAYESRIKLSKSHLIIAEVIYTSHHAKAAVPAQSLGYYRQGHRDPNFERLLVTDNSSPESLWHDSLSLKSQDSSDKGHRQPSRRGVQTTGQEKQGRQVTQAKRRPPHQSLS